MKRASILVLALSAVSAFAAPAAAEPQNQTLPCFLRSDLKNHTVGDGHTLYQDVSGQGVYRIVMSNACLMSAVTSDPVLWRDRTGSGRVCHKSDVEITAAGGK